ncbi:MAG: DinB family protein [Acidobacteriota bacterium]
MNEKQPGEIGALLDQFDAVERDAKALVAGLSETMGTAQPAPGSWSVAECLDHLATANRVYLAALEPPANRAKKAGRLRNRPAKPGWAGRLFIASLEPPPKWWSKLKAPGKIRPRQAPPLAGSFEDFMASLVDAQAFLQANVSLDLAGVRFPNPFIPGVAFSLATGLHILPAHARRHLWQAWRVRRALEGAEK